MTDKKEIRSTLLMKFLHYFITEEGYKPITLHGASNEIWLEKLDGDYKIVRLVSDYIHNDEQMNFDIFKTKRVVKKIKKKTFTYDMNTLNIYFNTGENANLYDDKKINSIKVSDVEDLDKYDYLFDFFPKIKSKLDFDEEGVKLLLKITEGLEKSSKQESKRNEEVFMMKMPILTYIIIGINIFIHLIRMFGLGDYILINFAYIKSDILSGQVYRLITGAFIHADLIHLAFNMYALQIIGSQVESYIGKVKFLIVYLFSAIMGGLLSILLSNAISVGASGAIFGLMGALLVFGYHYRIILGDILKNQILPLIIFNLALGFMIPGVDNAGHIGGLIGGVLSMATLGVKYKSSDFERLNGLIISIIWTCFIIYMLLFK